MRLPLLPLFLAVLLGACQHRAPVSKTPDGLYFVESNGGVSDAPPRLLLLEKGLFEVLEGNTPREHGTFEARDGLLRLRPASQGKGAELETTYAVVDGHLLIGVLRHVGDERRWTSSAFPDVLLGREPMNREHRGDAFRIDWDMEEGTWHFTSGGHQGVLNGVARFEPPAQAGRSFFPVFRPAASGAEQDTAAMGKDRGHPDGVEWGVFYRFGLQASPEAPWDWDGSLARVRPGTDARRSKEWSYDLKRAPSHFYERKGDVVVTPWTVDLGPVGLVPVRAEPSSVAGSYVSGKEALVVSLQPREPQTSNGYIIEGLFLDVHTDAGWCHYAPDARGLVVWESHAVGHPGMNHADKPYTLVCFALGDGRFVRYISSGGCSGMARPELDIFQQRAP